MITSGSAMPKFLLYKNPYFIKKTKPHLDTLIKVNSMSFPSDLLRLRMV